MARSRILAVLAGIALLAVYGAAQAGFEWVPGPGKKAEEPKAEAPAAPETVPQAQPQPVGEYQSLPLEPLPVDGEIDMSPPSEDITETPQQMRSIPATAQASAPQQEGAIKVKVITPATNTPAPPQDITATMPEAQVMEQQQQGLIIPPENASLPEPVAQPEQLVIPPAPAPEQIISAPATSTPIAPAPARAAPRVIMPTDAPDTALQTIPAAEKLQHAAEVQVTEPVQVTATPEVTPIAVAPTPQDFVTVEGFGSDMPLALALQQVVPAEFAFSFGSKVNAGERVSWQGGKPWNEVVSDMVAPLNLQASISGNTVFIHNGQAQQHGGIDTQASEELLKLGSAEDVARKNIQDPGEARKAQPEETMVRVKEITEARTQQEASVEPQALIEPAAGDAVEPAITEITEAPEAAEQPETIQQASITDVPAAETQRTAQPVSVPAPETPVMFWEAGPGSSLKETLVTWSEQANVKLVWNATHDYTISSGVLINDTFQNAVKTVMKEAIEKGGSPALTLSNAPAADDAQGGTLIIEDTQADKEASAG
jgi:hypothetical protein